MNSTTLLRNNPLPMLQIAGIHLPRETRRPSEVAAENLQAQSRFYVSPFDLSDVVEAEWADTKLQGSFKLSTDSYRWKSAEVEPLLSFFESYSTITIRRSEEATTARLTGMCSPTQLSTAPQFPRVSYQPTSAKYQQLLATLGRAYKSLKTEVDETASKSHDKLLRHYKELNSKLYSGRISKEERDSLRKLQDKLDELDEQDPDLVATVARVEKGYDELTSGLTQINRIIDGLLSR